MHIPPPTPLQRGELNQRDVSEISLFKGEFLWIENAEGVMLVDVKAAYRVYLRQRLWAEYQTDGITQRPLLMPKSIRLANGIEIESSPLDWGRLGFELTVGGHHLVLVRSVPRVLGSEIENLNILLNKLLSLTTVEHCIALLVDTVIQNQTFTEETHQALLRDLKNSALFNENEKNPFYKQLTLTQFRSIFF